MRWVRDIDFELDAAGRAVGVAAVGDGPGVGWWQFKRWQKVQALLGLGPTCWGIEEVITVSIGRGWESGGVFLVVCIQQQDNESHN